MPTPRAGIRRKIWTVYVLQVAAISLATILGVYGAATVLEDVLIKRALTGEAAFYWQRWQRNHAAPVPETNNMTGYLRTSAAAATRLPAPLRDLQPGYHRIQHNGAFVLVSDGPPGRLYLVFNQEQVGRLAFLFGFVPLILVLLIIYITTWLTYRASRRALSPVIALAKAVRDWDPKRPDPALLDPRNLSSDPDGDVETLARALHGYASRIEEFVERERNFTRDASHELRSPLTVIKIAADVLLEEQEQSAFVQRTLLRIRRSVRDMEAMLEAFLILARESDTGLPQEDFTVNDAVREEIERARPLLEGKPVTLELVERTSFALHAPPRVFAAVVGNLIRNACLYTESGSVRVSIDPDCVSVEDSGIGMSAEEIAHAFQPYFRGGRSASAGHGVGLSLVRRLSERFGWPVEMHSALGAGTTATIRFPQRLPGPAVAA